MEKAKVIFNRILYPPIWLMLCIASASFAALIFIFAARVPESICSYMIYSMSAYSLTIISLRLPRVIGSLKGSFDRLVSRSETAERYFSDISFRAAVSIYQGAAINLLYTVFRVTVGILYTSVWFISMAVYYLCLGVIRIYLIHSYKRRDIKAEITCYKNTAWSLFLLNIPMGGMIVLMVLTDSGYSYPGYVIYISALYTFYTLITSITNLVRFRRVGSPILSAAKVVNLVSAMMSVLGLQTAMIAQFSEHDEDYRKLMNTLTGGFIYGAVIIIAIYMLLHSKGSMGKEMLNEQK